MCQQCYNHVEMALCHFLSCVTGGLRTFIVASSRDTLFDDLIQPIVEHVQPTVHGTNKCVSQEAERRLFCAERRGELYDTRQSPNPQKERVWRDIMFSSPRLVPCNRLHKTQNQGEKKKAIV